MQATQQVIDMERMGKKGTLIHPEAYGEQPPMKTVPITDGEPVSDHPGLSPVDVYRLEILAMIDGKAKERQYNSGATLASYVNSTVPTWILEAEAFVAWRDAVWLYALAELDKVQAGERDQPSVEDFLAELPICEWPEA